MRSGAALRVLIVCACATGAAASGIRNAGGQEAPSPTPRPTPTATPTPIPSPSPTPSPDPRPDDAASDRTRGPAGDFALEVLRLSARADAVDGLWQAYRSRCQPEDVHGYDFGREWFALWDRALVPGTRDAGCGELLRQVVVEGGAVLAGLTNADSMARHSGVSAPTIHGMVRWNGLEWWALTVRGSQQAASQ